MRGRTWEGTETLEANVEYDKLPKSEQSAAVARDLAECLEELGGILYHGRVALPVGRIKYVWRCVLQSECVTNFSAWQHLGLSWEYEHGVLLLVMGTVAKRAFPTDLDVHFRENWGYFTSIDTRGSGPLWLAEVPVNTGQTSIVGLTLPQVKNTHALRTSLVGLREFLETETKVTRRVRQARDAMNGNLRRWLKQGLLVETGRWFLGARPRKDQLAEDEVFDGRLSRQVLRRQRDPRLMSDIHTILDLSAGRTPADPDRG